MEVAGIGLAVIAEVRSVVISIQTLIANIRQAAVTFRFVSDNLERLMRHIGEVDRLVRDFPGAIPERVSLVFNDTLTSVRDTLLDCKSSMEDVHSKAYAAGSTGVRAKLKSMLRRTAHITALTETMDYVQSQVKDASNQLLHLVSMLSTAVKIDAHMPKAAQGDIAAKHEIVYHPESSTPALSHTVHLNFDARSLDGSPSTPEAKLKFSILLSDSTATAAGVMNPVYGVVGMAGVGKSIALQGLASDVDIKKRFFDGIHFISLGQGATLKTIIDEVGRIMRITGGTDAVQTVEKCPSVRDVVDCAVSWFTGRVCLFLVDDVWPTNASKTGFLSDLRQLLRANSECRMVITTRSVSIAHAAGVIIDFGARDPVGSTSLAIFMNHATLQTPSYASLARRENLPKDISTILLMCGGLPFALAVAGSAVALLTREHSDFDSACDSYASRLQKQRVDLGDELGPEGTSLSAGIILSLNIIESEFSQLKTRYSVDTDHSIKDLYTSLCILSTPAWVPVSALSRMWHLKETFALSIVRLLSELSLAKVYFRAQKNSSEKKAGLMLHDLHLEFCRRQASNRGMASIWHASLLDGYLGRSPGTKVRPERASSGESLEEKLLSYKSRQWWSSEVPDDGYIHGNLARHLSSSNSFLELGALLLDARWTKFRTSIGGILALRTDFEHLMLQQHEISEGDQADDLKLCLEYILKAVHLSWGRVPEGWRSFQFQVCGRLLKLRAKKPVVRSYVESIEANTPMPYLLPGNQIFSGLRTSQILEIPVGSDCWAVSCSPCGRYVAVGAACDVLVLEEQTGNVVKQLKGHSKKITTILFTADSRKIISGARDKKVIIWEWEVTNSPVLTISHSCSVRGIALTSDNMKLFSIPVDGTIRAWDAITGSQEQEFRLHRSALSVALCPDNQTIALGLMNGTLSVLNILTGAQIFEDTRAHDKAVTSVAVSANGRRLATGSQDKTVRVWETESWSRLGRSIGDHDKTIYSVAMTPSGDRVASGSGDGTVRVWNAETGVGIWTSSIVHSAVQSIVFTQDAERIVAGYGDGNIRVWDTRINIDDCDSVESHTRLVSRFAVSQDGTRIIAGEKDGTLKVWDSSSGEQIGADLKVHRARAYIVCLSPDGRQVLTGSWDKMNVLYGPKHCERENETLHLHGIGIRCAAFSADGSRIVSGSFDNTVRVWDTSTRRQLGDPLEGHKQRVRAVGESEDGSYIVSQEQNWVTLIWESARRKCVWKSEVNICNDEQEQNEDTGLSSNEISDEEAKRIILSCGQEAPRLWPISFPIHRADVYSEDNNLYSNLSGAKTLLGALPSGVQYKLYNPPKKTFFALLESGQIAICKLKFEKRET